MMALNIREKLARIDQAIAEHGRARQEIRCAPWLAVMLAGATLFAAGAVFMKIWG